MKIIRFVYTDSIIKNSIYIIATNLCNVIVGFFYWALATRYYKPEDIGIVSAIISSLYLISMISHIGLPMSLALYLPMYKDNANKIINSCLILSVIVSTIISLVFMLGINIWIPELKVVLSDFKFAIIFILTTIMTTLSSLMTGIFIAGKRTSYHMTKENIFSTMKMVFLLLLSSLGLLGIFMSWSIGLAIATIVGFILVFRLYGYIPTYKFDPIIKNMTKFSIGNYVAGIFYNIPKFIFPILILGNSSAESAGYFFIAMTVANMFYGIPEAAAGPFIAESLNKDKFWSNVSKVLKFNMCLLIPGVLLIIIFGEFILNIFNQEYAEHSFKTLIILSVASIPLSFITVFNMLRNSQKKVWTVALVDAAVTITTLVLSISLMRIWNIEGIAIAFLIANTLVLSVITLTIKSPIEFARSVFRGYDLRG